MTEPTNESASVATEPQGLVGWIPPDAESSAPRSPRSAHLRSRIAIGTLGIIAVLGVLAGFQDIYAMDVFDRAFAGTLSNSEATEFDSAFGTMGMLQLLAIILAAIAFLAWQSRSVDNVPALGGGTPTVTPAWSIGWWFIPIANLFKPYQVVADLYRRMAPVERIGAGIVVVWWVVWMVNNLVGQLAGRLYAAADDLASVQTSLVLWALTDFGDVVGAGLAIVIVLRIQRWADGRYVGRLSAPNLEPEVSPVPTA